MADAENGGPIQAGKQISALKLKQSGYINLMRVVEARENIAKKANGQCLVYARQGWDNGPKSCTTDKTN